MTKVRTLISLPPADKSWLDAEAAARGEPMTRVVAQAIAEYRVRKATHAIESTRGLIESTAGLRVARSAAPEDGLSLQRRLRDDWADRPASDDAAPSPPRPKARPRSKR